MDNLNFQQEGLPQVDGARMAGAISRQRKWTPDEVRPKWGLALNVLRNEPVPLSLGR